MGCLLIPRGENLLVSEDNFKALNSNIKKTNKQKTVLLLFLPREETQSTFNIFIAGHFCSKGHRSSLQNFQAANTSTDY